MSEVNQRSENDELIKQTTNKWEDLDNPLAPLSLEQLAIIDEIGEYVKTRPLPDYVDEDAKIEDTDNRVETIEKFLTHYSKLEDELLEQDNWSYLEYYKQLVEWKDEVDGILNQILETETHLGNLKSEYQLVSSNTNTLHDACQQINAQQMVLGKTSNEIKERLQYFTSVESLLQRLSNPNLSVTSDIFMKIMDKIDECLAYCNDHPKYKECSIYSVKYKHCLARCVTMLKQHVSHHLQSVRSQLLQQTNWDTTNMDVFNAKFQANAPKLKTVIMNIEQRVEHCVDKQVNKIVEFDSTLKFIHTLLNPFRYETLLGECHEMYFTERKLLMSNSVHSAIIELSVRHKHDHCTLVRSGCAFLVHICTDEHQLFFQFFNNPTPLLTAYLEDLCTNLYDILRPIIIHVNHLETLSELCSIFRLEMLEEHVQNNPVPLEAFSKIAWQLLQDVQERLVFRAHLYLQSDILNYKPSPGDLAYPEKLEMMESIAMQLQEQAASHASLRRSDSRSSVASIGSLTSQEVARINTVETAGSEQQRARNGSSPADLHGMWYPPVRRTLLTLSRLYRCVERPIFQGLSQEALYMCVHSITQAASAIAARSSALDSKLFEIKHLLILREQVAPFQVDFTIKEMSLDFTKVKSAAYGLIQKRNRLFALSSNNAILEFLLEGTPTVKENLVDSRKEVDRQLKASCEEFILHCSTMMCSSLLTFLDKASTFTKMASETSTNQVSLRSQPFAQPETLGNIVGETQREVKNRLPQILRAMQLYLANKETEIILYRPIKNNIVNSLSALQRVLTENGYTDDDRLIVACPTTEQVLVLLSTAVSTVNTQHGDVETIREDSPAPTSNS